MTSFASLLRLVLLFLPFGCSTTVGSDYGAAGSLRRERATRMSVVDFWREQTDGDGLKVDIRHQINDWNALVNQLNDPFLNRSMLIEGDVWLASHRRPRQRAIPVMRARPASLADRITFSEWLREVSHLNKALKINVRSTDVVVPVLAQLYAAQDDLHAPVILHANVFRSPRSLETAVDAHTFVESTREMFADATISLGWTRHANYSALATAHKRLGWRQVLRILEHLVNVEQPVMLSVRLSVAARSTDQLLWLLSLDRPSVSLLIWSDDQDDVDDWDAVAALRRRATKNRVLYDLDVEHKRRLADMDNTQIKEAATVSAHWWRSVLFDGGGSTDDKLSTLWRGERGVVWVGAPAALLVSQAEPPFYPDTQFLEGEVQFLPHRDVYSVYSDDEDDSDSDDGDGDQDGLVVYLLDRLSQLDTPLITDRGIKIVIGWRGRLSIENQGLSGLELRSYDKRASAQLAKSDCYWWRVEDAGWRVTLSAGAAPCPSASPAERRRKRRRRRGGRHKRWTTRVELDTPFYVPDKSRKTSRRLRHVVLGKSCCSASSTFPSNTDVLLLRLRHSAAPADPSAPSRSVGNSAPLALLLFSLLFLLSRHHHH